MRTVIDKFDEIHASYHRLKCKKLIPCNCKDCKGSQYPHFYEYERLRKRLFDRRPEIECDKSYEMVNVQSLIDDVIIERHDDIKNEKVPDVIVNITNIKGNASNSNIIAGNQNAVNSER